MEMLNKEEIKHFLDSNEVFDIVTDISSLEENKEVQIKRTVKTEGEKGFSYVPKMQENCFYEPVARDERLIILGGGHISGYLCEFAARSGFCVWVIDEREEFASRKRFPDAQKVICGKFTEVLPKLHITGRDYVTIITRGHSCDGDCLYYILTHTMPGYLGMIGSKQRVQSQFALFRERGISDEKLKKVHSPIGLSIGGITPPEIAVSILAELILEKRVHRSGEIVRTELDYDVFWEWIFGDKSCAVATIIKAEGSSPRKEGAKMLIFEDRSILGSVGGGLTESKVIEKGHEMIGTGKAFLFSFEMNADVAARTGMACGGKVTVLIEDVKR